MKVNYSFSLAEAIKNWEKKTHEKLGFYYTSS